jgi:metal-sulfur cluster biosynthetic enzyme
VRQGDAASRPAGPARSPDSEEVLRALRHVVDPETGVNIVDLGLVYGASMQEGGVHVAMTMTTVACPLAEAIREQARRAIQQHVPGATSVAVDLVWQPPWDPSMMSAAARGQLGWR